MPRLNRRDFLKLAAITSGTLALSKLVPERFITGSSETGVIIFVFDAMTARNLSLYGYHRKTTPNLERFAARSTVFHSHYSAGNYTTPGTASLLTGTYPWTHRAINLGGLIARNHQGNNIFNAFGSGHQRFAYSQNVLATYLLDQFENNIEELLDPETFSVIDQVIGSKFTGDRQAAYRAFDDFLTQNSEVPASLVFGLLTRLFLRRNVVLYHNKDYPDGPVRTANYSIFFELKKVIDGVMFTLEGEAALPRLSYYHLWAPHSPYRATVRFDNMFLDNWKPVKKPVHRFGSQILPSHLNTRRRHYDEYVANLDDEFGRLLDFMEKKGILESNYVLVTSDHGEMFERGVDGHVTPLLYDPIVHIPLIVSSPGQTSRVDITSPTNSVDLLPTLLHLSGREIPDWCEGQILPGLGGQDDSERSTFSVEAKSNPAFSPLKSATIAMRKGNYKLIYYTGYEPNDSFELYDLENDQEELNDLYPANGSVAKDMRIELLAKLAEVNGKYQG